MAKNNYEDLFYKKIASMIITQIDRLNNHPVILKEVLPGLNSKMTDTILLNEIRSLFNDNNLDEDCITDRTYFNIKSGKTSSNAFNVFIIIYTLNDITSEVNKKYASYGKTDIEIPLMEINELLVSLDLTF